MVGGYHYQRQRAGRTTEDVVAPLPTLLHPRHHSTAGRVTSHIGEETKARVRPLMTWPFGRRARSALVAWIAIERLPKAQSTP